MSKPLKSNDVNELHSKKIPDIFVTLLVSKLLKSKVVNDEQPLNILYIFVALLKSKLDKFNTFIFDKTLPDESVYLILSHVLYVILLKFNFVKELQL